jgi:hypothetical protein
MRTNRHPMDYYRRPRLPRSEEALITERRILAWSDELIAYLWRGLITPDEMWRLINEGPPAQAHKGAQIAQELGVPVDAG